MTRRESWGGLCEAAQWLLEQHLGSPPKDCKARAQLRRSNQSSLPSLLRLSCGNAMSALG